jgi:uncharacterized phage-associated protein
MRPIHFRFDPEKMVQALAFLASRGVKNLDTMKSAKLLYFADRDHLLKYGRPITGDEYHVMKLGPIPHQGLPQIQDALAPSPKGEHDVRFDEYFAVKDTLPYRQFELAKAPDLEVFSASDIEILTLVAERYGELSALKLSEIAHEDEGVRLAEELRLKTGRGSVAMPYRDFFSGTDSNLLPLVEHDQDNRDFIASLTT